MLLIIIHGDDMLLLMIMTNKLKNIKNVDNFRSRQEVYKTDLCSCLCHKML
jgi:hypothetical protein